MIYCSSSSIHEAEGFVADGRFCKWLRQGLSQYIYGVSEPQAELEVVKMARASPWIQDGEWLEEREVCHAVCGPGGSELLEGLY